MSGPWNYCLAASILLLISFLSTAEAQKRFPSITSYSGKRRARDSVIEISHHGNTIAVAEWSPARKLLGCELIEMNNDEMDASLLQRLSSYSQPRNITFDAIFTLMSQCEEADKRTAGSNSEKNWNLLSIFKGIAPGTKWCGTGDTAKTFSDLGTQTDIDRCCRQHDFCPVSIRAHETKFQLTNKSFYTKMHCSCDDRLFSCLKNIHSTEAHLIGSIFFNLEQVSCLLSENGKYRFRAARGDF